MTWAGIASCIFPAPRFKTEHWTAYICGNPAPRPQCLAGAYDGSMTSDNRAYAHLPEPFIVPTYTAEQLDRMARTGTLMEKITVASRTNCPHEVLEWLMSNDDSEEIKREIINRSDITTKRLVWAAKTSKDANTLGRVAGHRLTPLETVRAIQAKASEREGEHEVWADLATFASRVIKRRETGQFEFGAADATVYEDQTQHPDDADD